tara:strand:- start:647 stop:1459 length:813 start_codon:yes stop_codon:yes gene_type:complete
MSSKPYLRIILFFVLGFIIYFADITMNYDEESKDIYISDQELDGLFSAWNSQVGRPPNEQEAINIINDFIEEEILYREALRLGLDQNDRIIKRRLAQKISFLKQETNRAEPDTEQLTDFFEMNLDKYYVPATFSFTHYYFSASSTAKIEATLALTEIEETGVPAKSEPFFLGKNFSEYSLGEIEQTFGKDMLIAFADPTLKKWIGPFSSSYGEHLLFINNKSIGYSPKFSEIRDLVRQDYMLQEQDRMLSDYLDSIKSEYKVIINPTYEL